MIEDKRLGKLLDAYFDQSLDEAERRELEEMLLSSSRARQLLHERAEQHGLLREWALRKGLENTVQLPVPRSRAKLRRVLPWLAGTMAACLTLAFLLLRDQPDTGARAGVTPPPAESPRATDDEVAFLAEVIGVKWANNDSAPAEGSALFKGPLVLNEGIVRLDFYSGARVYLEGPAKLELLSPDLARLHSGKLTAHVPPPAEGFTVLSPDVKVIDRGTEFGMSVGDRGDCQVHVFDGEVELHPEDTQSPVRSVLEGHAVSFSGGNSTDLQADRDGFASPNHFREASARQNERRWETWLAASSDIRAMEGLAVYYDFRNSAGETGPLLNRAPGAGLDTAGTIIGCESVPGRWSPKQALGFTRTSDRVRFRLEGSAASATMIAWVRVDSLPHKHNALLSMSPTEIGEIHWKLDDEGRLLLGLRADRSLNFESWERLVSEPVITGKNLGQWMLLATVIDGPAGRMRHYVNGREVASAALTRPVPIRLGTANLGNFDSGAATIDTRTFNGRFDEFAFFTRALSQEDIARFR